MTKSQTDPTPPARLSDKERLLKAKADLIEMEVGLRSGNLTTLDHIEKVMSDVIVRFRQRILAIPSRAAPLVINEEIEGAYKILTDLCEEALRELSTNGLRQRKADKRSARAHSGAYSATTKIDRLM